MEIYLEDSELILSSFKIFFYTYYLDDFTERLIVIDIIC